MAARTGRRLTIAHTALPALALVCAMLDSGALLLAERLLAALGLAR